MLADHPELDTLVVPVGGGGLLAGMAVAARHLKPGIELVGVQTERYPSMADRVHHTSSAIGGSTIAEGIAVPRAGDLTGRIIEALVDDVVTVTEEHVEEGINLLLEIEKVVTEGAGAAGIAALVEHRERFAGRTVGVVLSGGNVDPRLLASVIMRGLIRNGRLSRLHIEVPDVPGSLGTITTILGEVGANIVEILHQRMFVDLSAKSAEIEVTIETLDHVHVERAVVALEAAGYVVRLGTFTYRDAPPDVTPRPSRGRRLRPRWPARSRTGSDRGRRHKLGTQSSVRPVRRSQRRKDVVHQPHTPAALLSIWKNDSAPSNSGATAAGTAARTATITATCHAVRAGDSIVADVTGCEASAARVHPRPNRSNTRPMTTQSPNLNTA